MEFSVQEFATFWMSYLGVCVSLYMKEEALDYHIKFEQYYISTR